MSPGQDSCPDGRWEVVVLALLILNFTLAKERHEKARGIARWSRDTWPFPIMAPSVLKPGAGILLIMTTALPFHNASLCVAF